MKSLLGLVATSTTLLAFACGGQLDDRSYGASPLASAESKETGAGSCTSGALDACAVDGEEGMRICESGAWSPCAAFGTCRPDEDDAHCPGSKIDAPCTRIGTRWVTDETSCAAPTSESGSSSTPLVLSFERAPIVFTRPAGSFDLAGLEASVVTDWVSSATPWLAVDLDGNGSIDDGAELFGSMTRLPDGRRAEHGFEALAALDSDGDGRITPADERWSALVLWRDQNQDRRSQLSEIVSVERAGLVSIELGYHRQTRCTGTACEVERATFEFRQGLSVSRGAVVDVHFVY